MQNCAGVVERNRATLCNECECNSLIPHRIIFEKVIMRCIVGDAFNVHWFFLLTSGRQQREWSFCTFVIWKDIIERWTSENFQTPIRNIRRECDFKPGFPCSPPLSRLVCWRSHPRLILFSGISPFPSHDSSLPVHRFRICCLLAHTSICMSSARGAAGAVKPKLHNVNSFYAGKNQNAVKAPGTLFAVFVLVALLMWCKTDCPTFEKGECSFRAFSKVLYCSAVVVCAAGSLLTNLNVNVSVKAFCVFCDRNYIYMCDLFQIR